MGQKKNNKIILMIIILFVILMIITGVVYTYFSTDIFKNNKELFFQYIAQIGEEKNGFIDMSLKNYFEKQKRQPYTNQGKVVLNVTLGDETPKPYDRMNDFNISFSGKTDKPNQHFSQDISLNYSSEVTFPICYQKIENIIGLQTKYVGSKYIAIDMEQLEKEEIKEFLQVKNKIEETMNQNLFNKDEWKQIQENYMNVLNKQLQETQFTKIEENDKKGYKLTLTQEQIKNIMIQLLETLKNDNKVLDKINGRFEQNSSKITSSTIDNYIKELENIETSHDEVYALTIFQEKGEITEFVVHLQEVEIKIDKKKENDFLQYGISLTPNDPKEIAEVSFYAKYVGLDTLQNVKETYEVEIQSEPSLTSQLLERAGEDSISEDSLAIFKYQLENETNFEERIEIEEFSEENAIILNNYEEEEVRSFLEEVTKRIQMVNEKQMEELGLKENENPFMQMLAPILGIANYYQSTGNIQEVESNNNMAQLEINSFNSKFENYESTNLQGTTVKGLLSTVQRNNETQEKNRQIKEIHFDGEEFEGNEQNISYIKTSIELENYYRVEFERDENTGLIYRVVINKK